MGSLEEIWLIYPKYMKLRTAMFSSVKITIDKNSLFKIFEKILERDTNFLIEKKKINNSNPIRWVTNIKGHKSHWMAQSCMKKYS